MREARSLPVRVYRLLVDNSALLLVGAVTALAWANLAPASYAGFAHALHFAANDVGMAFFFALAAKEVFESTLPGGALGSGRRAALPVLAASGGMLGPALLFLGIAHILGIPGLARGWAIPCATDIAFSALVARGDLRPRPSGGAVPAPAGHRGRCARAGRSWRCSIRAGRCVRWRRSSWSAAAMAIAWLLRRRRRPQLLAVRPGSRRRVMDRPAAWRAAPRARARADRAASCRTPPRDLGTFDERKDLQHDTLSEFEHWWKGPVELILLAFGLVNAGRPVGQRRPSHLGRSSSR